ncbi:hypothetical protein Tco_0797485 [Tanacetum coccineum]
MVPENDPDYQSGFLDEIMTNVLKFFLTPGGALRTLTNRFWASADTFRGVESPYAEPKAQAIGSNCAVIGGTTKNEGVCCKALGKEFGPLLPWNWNLESTGIFSAASARRRIDEICLPNIGEETRWGLDFCGLGVPVVVVLIFLRLDSDYGVSVVVAIEMIADCFRCVWIQEADGGQMAEA